MKILDDYLHSLNEEKQRNAKFIEDEANKLLNSHKFKKYLGDKTLKDLGWKFEFFPNTPNDKRHINAWGYAAFNRRPYDKQYPHRLRIHRLFQSKLDIGGSDFMKVLKHEIAHCIDFYLRINTKSDKEWHDTSFYDLNEELWGDRNLAKPEIELKGVDNVNKYTICFEPSIGCDEGAIKLVPGIPKNYYSLGYIQSSIVDIIFGTVVEQFILTPEQMKTVVKAYGIEDMRKAKKRAISYNTITTYDIEYNIEESYKRVYGIVSEGKLGDIFKSAMVGAGIVGSTLGGADLQAKTAKEITPQVQAVSTAPTAKNVYKVGKNGSALWVLAATLFGEARGEPLDGKKAVASVIWNRAKTKSGKDLKNVCLKKYQFSMWNDVDSYNVNIKNPLNKRAWEECWKIAEQMVNGSFKPIINSDHYYAYEQVTPEWSKDLINKRKIGKHLFGKYIKK